MIFVYYIVVFKQVLILILLYVVLLCVSGRIGIILIYILLLIYNTAGKSAKPCNKNVTIGVSLIKQCCDHIKIYVPLYQRFRN